MPAPEVVVAGLTVVPEDMGEGHVGELEEVEGPLDGLGGPVWPSISNEGRSWAAARRHARSRKDRQSDFFPFAGCEERLGGGEKRHEDDLRGAGQDEQGPEERERDDSRSAGPGVPVEEPRTQGIQARAAMWL